MTNEGAPAVGVGVGVAVAGGGCWSEVWYLGGWGGVRGVRSQIVHETTYEYEFKAKGPELWR